VWRDLPHDAGIGADGHAEDDAVAAFDRARRVFLHHIGEA
jgi:hypothetical protein